MHLPAVSRVNRQRDTGVREARHGAVEVMTCHRNWQRIRMRSGSKRLSHTDPKVWMNVSENNDLLTEAGALVTFTISEGTAKNKENIKCSCSLKLYHDQLWDTIPWGTLNNSTRLEDRRRRARFKLSMCRIVGSVLSLPHAPPLRAAIGTQG